jgi:N-acetylglucosamine-6-sulfatase
MRSRPKTVWLAAGTLVTVAALASMGALAVPAVAPTGRAVSTDEQALAPPRTRPNVVVLMTDDQTVADLEVMPTARRLLGERGVTFNNSYVSYPVCCPSRASFLSGQYAHNHGVLGLYPPRGGYGRFDRWSCLPVWLREAGYATAHIGKYMNGYGSQVPDDVPPGWSEWYGAVDDSTYRMWGYTLNENGERHTYGSPFDEDPNLYQTDVYRDKAVDFIERRAPSGRPFFLSVAFLAPHHESDAIRAGTGHLVRPAPRHAGTLDPDPRPAAPARTRATTAAPPDLPRARPVAGRAHLLRHRRGRRGAGARPGAVCRADTGSGRRARRGQPCR